MRAPVDASLVGRTIEVAATYKRGGSTILRKGELVRVETVSPTGNLRCALPDAGGKTRRVGPGGWYPRTRFIETGGRS